MSRAARSVTAARSALGRDPGLYLAVGALLILPWLIAPGRSQPDTKIDLTVSPWRYLARSLSAWSDHNGVGELQNQAYGYLFPMGPVYGVCHSLGIPGWATQRVWWSLLLVVAFTGAYLVIRRLGRLAGPAALVGAAAYALAPRVLTVLPEISVEAWPAALAPWLVLAALPLLRPQLRGARLWRSVALTGLLTAALGGVNATASAMALVLPGVLLLVDATGRRRLPMWLIGVLLGAAWWVLPLVVLGRYAFPFLDYIETASITTAVTSVPNVLRGANDWIAYILDSENHPVWQGGWVLAQSVTAIVSTCTVAALGAVGLLRLRGTVARWALLCVVGATVFMALGHGGALGSPFSAPVRDLLDGPLAALRNVHKADPVLRLPLALGLAVVVQQAGRARSGVRRAVAGAAVVVLALSLTPIWQGRAAAASSYTEIPDSWRQAAASIDRQAARDGGSTLVLPAARTATFTWGTTSDEPLSALAASPVVTRAAAPLGNPASTRLLDAVDELAASKVAQPYLAAGLARMGITRIVLRRDVAASVRAQPWRAVQRTVTMSGGFREVATYGHGSTAVTVYDVVSNTASANSGRTADDVATYAADPVTVSGGPEALFALYATGSISAGQWIRLQNNGSGSTDVLTDTMRRRVYNNGVPTAYAYSQTLTADAADTRAINRAGARDLLPAGEGTRQPTRVLIGLSSVQVSSSAADPFARAYRSAGDSAYAAFDDDPSTAWLTGDHEQRARLSFKVTSGAHPSQLRLVLATGRGVTLPETVTVTVAGSHRTSRVDGRSALTGSLPGDAAAGDVSVTLDAPAGSTDPVMGLRSVALPGIRLGSVIDIPGRLDLRVQRVLITRQDEDATALVRRVHVDAAADSVPVAVRLRGDDATLARARATANGGTVHLGCGQVGSIRIGERTYALRATVPADRLTAGSSIRATVCGAVTAGSGQTLVTVTGAHGWQAETATVGRAPTTTAAQARTVSAVSTAAGRRSITLAAGGRTVVALDEGYNAGWRATDAAGRSLTPVLVDGWRQGFVVGSGDGTTVTATFGPGRWHVAGLLGGAGAVVLLVVMYLLAGWWSRRRPEHSDATSPTPRTAGHIRSPAVTVPTRLLGGAIAVLVGFLVAGPVGVLIGVCAALVPVRRRAPVALGALCLSGVLMAAFGVVAADSFGAWSGQALGSLSLCVLAAAIVRSGDAPSGSPDARSAAPTPHPADS